MKKLLVTGLFLGLAYATFCQSQGSDNDAVKNTINRALLAMQEDDTAAFQDEFAGDVRIQYVESKNDTVSNVITVNPAEYLKQVAKFKADAWTEKITRYDDMNISNGMATIWASYKFYFGSKFDHCGTTVFQMVKRKQRWKIVSILYTIKAGNCAD
ncbi:MAG: hypothetical protein JST19_00230 [Bacteroidetes bacterium]|nr:hypothetical protein [Bacteroidota bacterium]